MTIVVTYGLAAGLMLALACGDSAGETAAAGRSQPGPKRTARPPTDACTLLTQAEAEAILGTPVSAPTKGGSGECRYEATSGRGDIMLHVLPLEFGSKEEFHAFLVEDTRKMNERVKKGFKSTGATPPQTSVDPVPEVAGPAYYVDPALVIFKGGRALNILAADRRQAVAVAARALPRFE